MGESEIRKYLHLAFITERKTCSKDENKSEKEEENTDLKHYLKKWKKEKIQVTADFLKKSFEMSAVSKENKKSKSTMAASMFLADTLEHQVLPKLLVKRILQEGFSEETEEKKEFLCPTIPWTSWKEMAKDFVRKL